MKYLCLVCPDEKSWDALPGIEHEPTVGEILDDRREQRTSGRLLASEARHRSRTAATVRVRSGGAAGGAVVTDGPFAETREQLGGFP